ncbi:hypothetical protein MPTK1_3g01300 [Marchantia polymorpha subsp. ruderalis]|uniref:Ribulose bisphosphate carboxylase large chain n=2 Tax=Marchantia polymorpha TaxID=3197 RepID=A0AAF6AW97_MARPO|nr:hypothetical protein MARPO_0007s0124 [Marchantia polymorpha]BBN04031.1 hypothetical protein Mp_3g01300 [Marchantia polymorpha subsp. ruderalis]|eukprot:PTQ47718.1 hypothetical protein MARPO_0007s0124 [Marchantia polymorpha]
MFTSIVGNVFGFKAIRALRLEDVRIPPAYTKTSLEKPNEKKKIIKREKLMERRSHGIKRHQFQSVAKPVEALTTKLDWSSTNDSIDDEPNLASN